MTLRPPTVLTRTVRYAHDGGRLLEHLAAAGLIATTDDGSGARPLDAVLLESVDIATKVSRTTIAVLEACARLTCQGPTVTVEALPRAPADGRAALARLREALADYVVAGPGVPCRGFLKDFFLSLLCPRRRRRRARARPDRCRPFCSGHGP